VGSSDAFGAVNNDGSMDWAEFTNHVVRNATAGDRDPSSVFQTRYSYSRVSFVDRTTHSTPVMWTEWFDPSTARLPDGVATASPTKGGSAGAAMTQGLPFFLALDARSQMLRSFRPVYKGGEATMALVRTFRHDTAFKPHVVLAATYGAQYGVVVTTSQESKAGPFHISFFSEDSGKLLARLPTRTAQTCVVWSESANLAYSCGRDRGPIRGWCARQFRERCRMIQPGGAARCLVAMPGPMTNILLAGGSDGAIRVYDLTKNRVVPTCTLVAHELGVRSISLMSRLGLAVSVGQPYSTTRPCPRESASLLVWQLDSWLSPARASVRGVVHPNKPRGPSTKNEASLDDSESLSQYKSMLQTTPGVGGARTAAAMMPAGPPGHGPATAGEARDPSSRGFHSTIDDDDEEAMLERAMAGANHAVFDPLYSGHVRPRVLAGHEFSVVSVTTQDEPGTVPHIVSADVSGVVMVWSARNFSCLQTFCALFPSARLALAKDPVREAERKAKGTWGKRRRQQLLLQGRTGADREDEEGLEDLPSRRSPRMAVEAAELLNAKDPRRAVELEQARARVEEFTTHPLAERQAETTLASPSKGGKWAVGVSSPSMRMAYGAAAMALARSAVALPGLGSDPLESGKFFGSPTASKHRGRVSSLAESSRAQQLLRAEFLGATGVASTGIAVLQSGSDVALLATVDDIVSPQAAYAAAIQAGDSTAARIAQQQLQEAVRTAEGRNPQAMLAAALQRYTGPSEAQAKLEHLSQSGTIPLASLAVQLNQRVQEEVDSGSGVPPQNLLRVPDLAKTLRDVQLADEMQRHTKVSRISALEKAVQQGRAPPEALEAEKVRWAQIEAARGLDPVALANDRSREQGRTLMDTSSPDASRLLLREQLAGHLPHRLLAPDSSRQSDSGRDSSRTGELAEDSMELGFVERVERRRAMVEQEALEAGVELPSMDTDKDLEEEVQAAVQDMQVEEPHEQSRKAWMREAEEAMTVKKLAKSLGKSVAQLREEGSIELPEEGAEKSTQPLAPLDAGVDHATAAVSSAPDSQVGLLRSVLALPRSLGGSDRKHSLLLAGDLFAMNSIHQTMPDTEPLVAAVWMAPQLSILTATATTLVVWDLLTGRPRRVDTSEAVCCGAEIMSVSLNGRHRKIIVGDNQGRVWVVNASNGASMLQLDPVWRSSYPFQSSDEQVTAAPPVSKHADPSSVVALRYLPVRQEVVSVGSNGEVLCCYEGRAGDGWDESNAASTLRKRLGLPSPLMAEATSKGASFPVDGTRVDVASVAVSERLGLVATVSDMPMDLRTRELLQIQESPPDRVLIVWDLEQGLPIGACAAPLDARGEDLTDSRAVLAALMHESAASSNKTPAAASRRSSMDFAMDPSETGFNESTYLSTVHNPSTIAKYARRTSVAIDPSSLPSPLSLSRVSHLRFLDPFAALMAVTESGDTIVWAVPPSPCPFAIRAFWACPDPRGPAINITALHVHDAMSVPCMLHGTVGPHNPAAKNILQGSARMAGATALGGEGLDPSVAGSQDNIDDADVVPAEDLEDDLGMVRGGLSPGGSQETAKLAYGRYSSGLVLFVGNAEGKVHRYLLPGQFFEAAQLRSLPEARVPAKQPDLPPHNERCNLSLIRSMEMVSRLNWKSWIKEAPLLGETLPHIADACMGVVWEGAWWAHDGPIMSVQHAAGDLRATLTSSVDGLARIWDLEGRLLGTLDTSPRFMAPAPEWDPTSNAITGQVSEDEDSSASDSDDDDDEEGEEEHEEEADESKEQQPAEGELGSATRRARKRSQSSLKSATLASAKGSGGAGPERGRRRRRKGKPAERVVDVAAVCEGVGTGSGKSADRSSMTHVAVRRVMGRSVARRYLQVYGTTPPPLPTVDITGPTARLREEDEQRRAGAEFVLTQKKISRSSGAFLTSVGSSSQDELEDLIRATIPTITPSPLGHGTAVVNIAMAEVHLKPGVLFAAGPPQQGPVAWHFRPDLCARARRELDAARSVMGLARVVSMARSGTLTLGRAWLKQRRLRNAQEVAAEIGMANSETASEVADEAAAPAPAPATLAVPSDALRSIESLADDVEKRDHLSELVALRRTTTPFGATLQQPAEPAPTVSKSSAPSLRDAPPSKPGTPPKPDSPPKPASFSRNSVKKEAVAKPFEIKIEPEWARARRLREKAAAAAREATRQAEATYPHEILERLNKPSITDGRGPEARAIARSAKATIAEDRPYLAAFEHMGKARSVLSASVLPSLRPSEAEKQAVEDSPGSLNAVRAYARRTMLLKQVAGSSSGSPKQGRWVS
jgi:hypothetical protein